MKIALYSDLHREIKEWTAPELASDVDVMILAGDIGSHTHGLDWATTAFPGVHTLYIAGNHEYYSAHLGMLAELQKPLAGRCHFLEKQTFEHQGVRFLGCTLWSAFDLYGIEGMRNAMSTAGNSINDYWSIYAAGGKLLEPSDTLKLHRKAVQWLDTELSKPFDGKTVVITHFAPHRQCVDQKHTGSALSPYFVTDLTWIMRKHRIDAWCYGHTHSNIRFIEEESGCLVTTNQLCYPSERSRTEFGIEFDSGFRNDFTFEI